MAIMHSWHRSYLSSELVGPHFERRLRRGRIIAEEGRAMGVVVARVVSMGGRASERRGAAWRKLMMDERIMANFQTISLFLPVFSRIERGGKKNSASGFQGGGLDLKL